MEIWSPNEAHNSNLQEPLVALGALIHKWRMNDDMVKVWGGEGRDTVVPGLKWSRGRGVWQFCKFYSPGKKVSWPLFGNFLHFLSQQIADLSFELLADAKTTSSLADAYHANSTSIFSACASPCIDHTDRSHSEIVNTRKGPFTIYN